MQQSDVVEFSFSLQYPYEIKVDQQINFKRNSSADISSEEENDLELKIQQLYSKTKQALQSIDQKETLKEGRNTQNQSDMCSYLVCSKSLPYAQLLISNNVFARNHQIKGFTTISPSKHKQKISMEESAKKQNKFQGKQKIRFNSYLSIPNRNICFTYVSN
ncbi:unnamed protein product (macronuclear) [Paramecium tetraurelia]|uniref:Uncharacterized protein n=1 Tax=Paramecium tetraurelia TaxID=5888 RepID=A0C0V1_PARTE|nr:uncharacterized protein GSPATT00033894001 [Paramecium tetraurelia]CAK64418.1 unnamed protein product [Paramecium tetraurelia]|eukprot:XP_001431816.1 hypothetical protein (macronuclear) [Paramecium tetraurelia strain d4-2]